MLINTIILKENKIDPYPYILLNLILSCISALQAPIIMMSQNRASKKDSLRNQNDYKIDLKSELLLEDLHHKVEILINNQNRLRFIHKCVVDKKTIQMLRMYYYVDINNKQRDEQEAYESVITVRDTALCNNYMERYPEGIHYNEVKELYLKLVSEAKDWNDACINGTRNGFIHFLNNHPDSGYEQACNDKIDSLDFVAALSANTVEAYKLYLDNHPKGLYTDQALQAQEKIDELTVKPEEEIQIEKLCETFFSSLATKNEEILLSTVDNVMDNFLNKKNATHSDIKTLSEKLAEGSSNPKTFIVNNDFNIHKSYESSGDLSYNVTFSVNGINSDNQMAEKYAVNVIVGSNMKIKSLGMKRSASNDTNKGQE